MRLLAALRTALSLLDGEFAYAEPLRLALQQVSWGRPSPLNEGEDVPIAVSAFSSEALEKQQIKNASDLQLTLPNVTFTKGNFTGSSFTIRGIGDLCVGVTCDSATAIHMNDAPLFGTRPAPSHPAR